MHMNSKENKEEKISSNIEKYNTIMESYRNKKFSKSHLTMKFQKLNTPFLARLNFAKVHCPLVNLLQNKKQGYIP